MSASRVPPDIAAAVEERSGGWCELRLGGCLGRATHKHHRQRRQIGGHSLAQLLHLCSSCHAAVHAFPKTSYDRGWLIHSWQDPASIPVKPSEVAS